MRYEARMAATPIRRRPCSPYSFVVPRRKLAEVLHPKPNISERKGWGVKNCVLDSQLLTQNYFRTAVRFSFQSSVSKSVQFVTMNERCCHWGARFRTFASALLVLTLAPLLRAAALEPIFELKHEGRFITRNQIEFDKFQAQMQAPAFLAVCTNVWPAGMVPVFAVERTNRFELRRRPPRGQESFSSPLFFALPREDEHDARKLAGHWEGTAHRPGGTRDYPAWELTLEGDVVAGRFDQNTEYRYAFVSGGTFRSNRLDLRVDYMNESWFLVADWTEGMLKGTWRRGDDSEQGSWEATRPQPFLPPGNAVPLFEWRRASDGARRYRLADETPGAEWERAPRPLCRVWRK